MSLMGTLAKIAVGVVVAKGVGSVIQAKRGSSSGTGDAPDMSVGQSSGHAQLPGGLDNIMGEILGGRAGQGSAGQGSAGADAGGGFGLPGGGGLGDLLESLGGGARTGGGTGGGSGGLGELIGQLGRGTGGGTGGLGDLLGGLLGGAVAGGLGGASRGSGGSSGSGAGGSFGDLLNQALGSGGEPEAEPSAEQDAVAGLMLRAMIQAAKSDGRIDAAEQRKLMGNLGEASEAEMRFVQQELAAPVDIPGLARQVPRGLEQQVYTMSVISIDLDQQNEARYLAQLGEALGLNKRVVNAIHAQLGAPALYA